VFQVGRRAIGADGGARGIGPVQPVVAVGAESAERAEPERGEVAAMRHEVVGDVAGVTRPASRRKRHSGSIMS